MKKHIKVCYLYLRVSSLKTSHFPYTVNKNLLTQIFNVVYLEDNKKNTMLKPTVDLLLFFLDFYVFPCILFICF